MYEKTVLPNGVRVISEYLPHVRSITVGAWFAVGSRHEEAEQQGMAHFIEHMLFQSTEKYSAREIAEIMDHSGSYFNAFTGRERTCFYFKVLDEYWSAASDVIRQMLLHPLLAPEEVAKERQVVLEELKMYQDDPEDQVQDLLPRLLWSHNALGNSILGTASTVRSFTRAKTRAFLQDHYTGDRLVIASVGNITHSQVVDELASAFVSLPRGKITANNLCVTPTLARAKRKFYNKKTEQVHFCLGRSLFSRTDTRRYALYLLDTIVGGAASSLLFQELREKHGLVYNTYSFANLYSDIGCYGIYAGFSLEQWNQVWDVICDLFLHLTERITPEMLARAQAQLRGSILLALEDTESRMIRLAKAELDNAASPSPDQFLADIAAVQYQDLLTLCEEIFVLQEWSSIALGPHVSLKEDMICQQIC